MVVEASQASVGPGMSMKKARQIHSAAFDQTLSVGVAGMLGRIVAESLFAGVAGMLAQSAAVVVAAGILSAGLVRSLSVVVAESQ